MSESLLRFAKLWQFLHWHGVGKEEMEETWTETAWCSRAGQLL